MIVNYGSFSYRIGGYDDSGNLRSNVEMAALQGDGFNGEWTNTGFLPEGKAHGAAFAAGGLIYILGGYGSDGITRDIYYTEIRRDGSLGFGTERRWEKNVRPLPKPIAAPSCIYWDGRILLAGGRGADGKNLNSLIHARLYWDGKIGQWYESLETLSEPTAIPYATMRNSRLYIAKPAKDNPLSFDGAESWAVQSYFRLSDHRLESSLPWDFFSSAKTPLSPTVMSGSGYIPNRSYIVVVSAPGTVVGYRRDGQEVTSASGEFLWNPDYPGYLLDKDVALDYHFDFRAVDDAGSFSSQVSVNYHIWNVGFFPFPRATLLPVENPDSSTLCTMVGTTSWFTFQGQEGSHYAFVIDDKASSPEKAANTGSVKVSVFETDKYTPVIDTAGNPLLDITSDSPPREFVAGQGAYYFFASEIDEQADKSFATAFVAK
ncbi:MAG: hypothetical protein Q8O19_03545 [Rectinemataceae bacterium]|nr:hypothetical protein [Rectinemataceae bacterium]